MIEPRLALDHIAIVAPSLEVGLDHVETALGVRPPTGGTHPAMGTRNALMRLGQDEYLEVIAPDPNAPTPGRPRWFGLDLMAGQRPRLGTWVTRVDDLESALAAFPPSLGPATPLSRGTLTWRISVPDDGGMPFGGAFPSLIEWPTRPYPGAAMSDLGCRLAALKVAHPNAAEIAARLGRRLDDPRVSIDHAEAGALTATIETPSGLRTLI